MPDQCGAKYFFAKASDKFVPLEPTLISPKVFGQGERVKLVTMVNSEVLQEAEFLKDMDSSPVKMPSWMSQGKFLYFWL